MAISESRPWTSENLRVPKQDVEKENQKLKERGLAARFDNEGRAVCHSRAARRELLRDCGLVDKDGGYGD